MCDYGFGAIPSSKDFRDYKIAASLVQRTVLPESYILTPTKIKNQGIHLTCVAHALASLVEFYNLQETGYNYTFSTEFIYGCRKDTDYLGEGMQLRDGLKVLQKYGDVLYSELPGNTTVQTARKKVCKDFDTLVSKAAPNKINTYYKITSLDEIKYSILQNNPVPAVMKWHKDASVKKDGIYHYSSNEIKNYHAVLIIGWDKDYLIIQNSWGKLWGKDGLFYVPLNKIQEIFCEFYGVTDSTDHIQKPKQLIDTFGPTLNLICNIIIKIIKYIRKENI